MTVTGEGKASFKPDATVINVTLTALDKSYDAAMTLAENRLDAVRRELDRAGIGKENIRTADFSVRAEKKGVHDRNGNYVQEFVGYKCTHLLTVTFDFDTKLLGNALGALSDSGAEPELEITFTVKDKTAVQNAVLEAATKSALSRAKVLAAASGVKLGEIVKIDYRVAAVDPISQTRFMACNAADARARSIDINPEDVNVSDSVAVTWNII